MKSNHKSLRHDTFPVLCLLVFLALAAMVLCARAQINTNTPAIPADSGSFFESVTAYFTSFNTNLDSTFAGEKGSLWVGIDSIQNGKVPLANQIGLSYDVWKAIDIEGTFRNAGVAGTVLDTEIGFGFSFIVHDAKLTLYGRGGYDLQDSSTHADDRLFGEIGLRVCKALTAHTFAGVGLGVQLPKNTQVLSAFAGFTF